MKEKKSPIICLCNKITLDTINKAIEEGVQTTDELYDKTGAGVGPCGGSCRKQTQIMIDYFKKHRKLKKY